MYIQNCIFFKPECTKFVTMLFLHIIEKYIEIICSFLLFLLTRDENNFAKNVEQFEHFFPKRKQIFANLRARI